MILQALLICSAVNPEEAKHIFAVVKCLLTPMQRFSGNELNTACVIIADDVNTSAVWMDFRVTQFNSQGLLAALNQWRSGFCCLPCFASLT